MTNAIVKENKISFKTLEQKIFEEPASRQGSALQKYLKTMMMFFQKTEMLLNIGIKERERLR